MRNKVQELLDRQLTYYQNNRKRVWLLIGVLIVVGFGAQQLTSAPGICGNCHEIRPAAESWQKSTHSGITCDNCHDTPGIGEAMRRVYLQFAVFRNIHNQPETYVKTKKVPTEVCRQCHSANRTMAYSGGLNVPHELHLEKGYTCTMCHLNLVHGEGGEKTRKPQMETCMQCHNGKTAPEGCGTCHLTLSEPISDY